jgi:hypothetical protein
MNPHIQILQENEHTHEADDDMIGENEALNQMKDAIREDPTCGEYKDAPQSLSWCKKKLSTCLLL